jgi:hypothetical protein
MALLPDWPEAAPSAAACLCRCAGGLVPWLENIEQTRRSICWLNKAVNKASNDGFRLLGSPIQIAVLSGADPVCDPRNREQDYVVIVSIDLRPNSVTQRWLAKNVNTDAA